jgi:hypothetical protein
MWGVLGLLPLIPKHFPFDCVSVQLSSTLIMLGPIIDKLSACQVIEGHFLIILES